MKTIICFLIVTYLFYHETAIGQWIQTYGPYGGKINTIATLGKSTVFVGTTGDGIFRSSNNGTTWLPVNNGLTGSDCYFLTARGSDVFAGTDDGLFRFSNNLVKWVRIGSQLTGMRIASFFVYNNLFFVITNAGGTLRSTNNGVNWTLIPAQINRDFAVLGKYLFVAGYGGVRRSSDNGDTWEEKGPEHALDIASGKHALYIATKKGFYISTDYGENWTRRGIKRIEDHYEVRRLYVQDSIIYAATDGELYYTTNEGQNWLRYDNGLVNHRINFMTDNKSYFFVGTDGGIYRTPWNMYYWEAINIGLIPDGVVSLATNGDYIFAGTRNAGFFLSDSSGMFWHDENHGVIRSHVRCIAVKNDTLFVGADRFRDNEKFFVSTNLGRSWRPNSSGIFYTTIYSLVFNERYIFAGGKGYSGVYWKPLTYPRWISCDFFNVGVYSMLISKDTLFVGASSGVYRSTDKCENFVQLDPDSMRHIAMVLAQSGNDFYVGTKYDGMFRSTNRGISWTRISSGLPSRTPIYAFVSRDNALIVGTDSGVFLSLNRGESWSAFNQGLNNMQIRSLLITGKYLFAGTTYRGGLWRRPLMDIPTSITNLHASNTHGAFKLEQNYPNHLDCPQPLDSQYSGISLSRLKFTISLGRRSQLLSPKNCL